jgi:hypothetical protein
MTNIPLDALFTACIDPPSLLAPTPVWLRYLRDLRKMRQCRTVRAEIHHAKQELARRRQIEIAKRAELASKKKRRSSAMACLAPWPNLWRCGTPRNEPAR